ILSERRLGFDEHERALALLGGVLLGFGACSLAACNIAFGDDGAKRFDANCTERDRTRERDDDDAAMLRELLANELPRRVDVRADELAGLKPPQIFGERARIRVPLGRLARHR